MKIKKSIDITPILEIGRTDTLTKILEENEDYISYLPYFTTEEKVKTGKLVYLDVHDIKTGIRKQLIHRKNKWLSNSMKVFPEYVKSMNLRGNICNACCFICFFI